MRKSKIFKTFVLLLAMAMLAAFSACGKTDGSFSEKSTAVKEQSTSASNTQVSIDPFGKYEPGIELTSVKYDFGDLKFKEIGRAHV